MRSRSFRIVVLLCLVASVGCNHTIPIPEPYVIPLPAGMTAQQADVAVICGILNTSPPADYDPLQTLSDAEFKALIWQKFVGSARSRSWFPESREQTTIYAAVSTRGHYLRAAIERQSNELQIAIVESRNLAQNGGRIHKAAIKWMRNLDAHIRREVGRMAMMLSSSGTQPLSAPAGS